MINVAVLGATGAVGQRFVEQLAAHPWFNLSTLAASERSAGKPYGTIVKWRLDTPFPEKIGKIRVVPTSPKAMKDVDLVLSSQPSRPRSQLTWNGNLQMQALQSAVMPVLTGWIQWSRLLFRK